MTSMTVTSQMCSIISQDDPRIAEKQYKPGDKFILTKLDDSFSKEIISLFKGKKVILEVLGYALTHEREIAYDLLVQEPKELTFRWLLSEQDLEECFMHIENVRFVLIDL